MRATTVRTFSLKLALAGAFLTGCGGPSGPVFGAAADATSDASGNDVAVDSAGADATKITGDVATPDALPDAPDVVAPDAGTDATGPKDAGSGDVPADADAAPSVCNGGCASGAVCDVFSNTCVQCLTSADCANSGDVCIAQTCSAQVACYSGTECDALGGVCSSYYNGYCVDCVTGIDCLTGYACKDATCVPAVLPCKSNKDCKKLGKVCGTSGECGDCATSSDCSGSGIVCAGGLCVPPLCEPYSTQCLDPSTSQYCAGDGSAWQNEPCFTGQTCVGTMGCVAQICTPSAPACQGTQAGTCDNNGASVVVSVDCASTGQACDGGVCVAKVCDPYAYQCKGTLSQKCDSAGAKWLDYDDCSLYGYVCSSGQCSMPVCTPNAPGCNGTDAGICNADGSDWNINELCMAKGFGCDQGNCVPLYCNPNESVCDGTMAQTCNAGGSGFDPYGYDCSQYGEICINGSCSTVVCSPSQWLCEGNKSYLCDATGAAANLMQDCDATGTICVSGSCVTCIPGAVKCSGTQAQICSSASVWQNGQNCAKSGLMCIAGSCSDGAVAPNKLALSGLAACGLHDNGTVSCWGGNPFGQIGDGSVVDAPSPVTVTGLNQVVSISAGWSHHCATRQDGSLWCWGGNHFGQIGNGKAQADYANPDTAGEPTAQAVAGIPGVKRFFSQSTTSYILGIDGTVWAWGLDECGATGLGIASTCDDPTGSTIPAVVKTPKQVTALQNVVWIAAGNAHACALTLASEVLCWGDNRNGQVGNGKTAASYSGLPAELVPVAVSGLPGNVETLWAGTDFTCARMSNSDVYCWGNYTYGQDASGNVGSPSGTPKLAVSLSAFVSIVLDYASCGIAASGQAECWGMGGSATGFAQTGGGSGSVVAPQSLGLAGAVIDARAGYYHGCASLYDGSIWCWTNTATAPLGDGTTSSSDTPLKTQFVP